MVVDQLLKTKKEYTKLKKHEIQDIYQNKLDKPCFQEDIAYEDFKDLPGRTAFNKTLCEKSFNIAKRPEKYGYQRFLALNVYNLLIKSLLLTNKEKIILKTSILLTWLYNN